jgi:DNA helicase-2/ATP-dependent DNA helicase PcrA
MRRFSAGSHAVGLELLGLGGFTALIGEIIPELYRYLRNNPAAPEPSMYDHVLVDEYQDLNKAEQAVVDLLCGTASLCIVGDDDQSLYGFKHAHPEGIRTFPQTHAGTTDHDHGPGLRSSAFLRKRSGLMTTECNVSNPAAPATQSVRSQGAGARICPRPSPCRKQAGQANIHAWGGGATPTRVLAIF